MGNLFRCEVGKKEPDIFFSGGYHFVGGTMYTLPKVVVGQNYASVKIEPPKSGKARIYVHVGSVGGWELTLQSSEFALEDKVYPRDIYEFEAYLELYREYYINISNNLSEYGDDIVSISATVVYI